MSLEKDYVHFDWHISKENGEKMNEDDMHNIQNAFLEVVNDLGFNTIGSVRLEDDSELAARLDYGDDVIERAAIDASLIPEEGPDELDSSKRDGFLKGANFVRAIIDERYK